MLKQTSKKTEELLERQLIKQPPDSFDRELEEKNRELYDKNKLFSDKNKIIMDKNKQI